MFEIHFSSINTLLQSGFPLLEAREPVIFSECFQYLGNGLTNVVSVRETPSTQCLLQAGKHKKVQGSEVWAAQVW
jgi:hypothetical protein